ncbi:hypothetical protein C366_00782 [Cryptococcus neoformans Tu401-1]|nr:hypothetical protein C365_00778 [Cryptococcus neoformans var. grubii Bt85]OXC68477.1 hypothetical protein AYX13_02928 [Cryptococcus neoformans var. grubii]OXG23401.1 hypothetical protein C366_00782 [Cryptococcus neoformans var. grubii Tu401-1]OXM81809.1 hypothetical protein C364_00782 [Cryptococcus neoformans var. grubii Bt63]
MAPRRSRPTHGAIPNDDIPTLSLPEVKERLARNTALLNSPLFAQPTSPSVSGSTSKAQGADQGSSDPIREKLVKAREALLMREQELMMQNMNVGASSSPEASNVTGDKKGKGRESVGGVSGKQRVLESIRAGEGLLAKNGLILPMDQTLSLGQRDYINSTTHALSSLTLDHTRSSSPKPRNPTRTNGVPRSRPSRSQLLAIGDGSGSTDNYGGDEVARAERLARLNAFMSYKGSDDEWSDSDDDEDEGYYDYPEDGQGEMVFETMDDSQIGYKPNGMPLRRKNATGEEVDEYGMEDDEFAEGNSDYENGAGDEPTSGAPGR